ncbi:hypothetical protein AAY473_013661 [Plecturocebus cupreus]
MKFSFIETISQKSHSVAQARVQWHNLGLLQPQPPGLKRVSHCAVQADLELLGSSDAPALASQKCWDYRETGSLSPRGWNAVVQSQLTAISASWVQVSLPASASQVAGITGARHHAELIFVFLVEMGFHQVGQAGLELLTSDGPLSGRLVVERVSVLVFLQRLASAVDLRSTQALSWGHPRRRLLRFFFCYLAEEPNR